MNNEEDINWFGMPKKGKAKPKLNSNRPFNYFGNPKTKVNANVNFLGGNIKKLPQKINYFGLKTTERLKTTEKHKKHKMFSSLLFKKESIKNKKLSKWGDADLDGSPNYFDCDPRNAFKDAKKGVMTAEQLSALYLEKKRGSKQRQDAERMLEIIEGEPQPTSKQLKGIEKEKMLSRVRGNIYDLKKANVKEKRTKFKENLKETFGGVGSSIKERIKPTVYSPLDEYSEKSKKNEEELKKREEKWDVYIKEAEKSLPPEEYAKEEKKYLAFKEDTKQQREKATTKEKKISQISESTEKITKMMKGTGPQAVLDVARYVIEQKEIMGKKPSKKELAALVKAEKKIRKIGDIQSEGRISREILTKVPMGEVGRVLSGAGVDKTGEYSRALKAKSRRVKAMTRYAAGQIFGDNLLRTRFDSEPRARGRPAGPSGEYKIGGRPVYEEDFQQYAAKQNALNRMLPSQQQSATLNPEYIAYLKAQKAAERGETQTVMTEDGMPMEGIPQAEQSEGFPTMGSSMMQTGQQQQQIQEKRAYNRATPDEVKAAQYQAQAVDNPLMAPNFMRGELKAAGGSILTPIGPSILEAPQVFKGEMRNVVKTNPDEGEVKLSERPQTNPWGDEWLDIEIGSGKPVIRKRVRERWMTGESL